MPSESVQLVNPRVAELVEQKSAPEYVARIRDLEAAAIFRAMGSLLAVSDLDGVRFPFNANPNAVRMDRFARLGIRHVRRLANGLFVAVTGGALDRTRLIMAREAFGDVELMSSYGAARWVPNGAGGMQVEKHEYVTGEQATVID